VINQPLHMLVLAMLSSLLMTACGGGGNDAAERPQASTTSAAPLAVNVQLEGCVVNSEWMGARDTAVHVRTVDGRMVGTAFTNRQGVFVATVPARSTIVLDTAADGPGEIVLNTGSGSLSVAACLRTDL